MRVWAPYGYVFLWHLSRFCLHLTVGKLHVMLFPCSECRVAESVEKKTMSHITTCQEFPVTQPWHRKRHSFTSYADDHDAGTCLSLQRTRHVNTSSLAGLSDTVWPIGQLPVNKILGLYHPLLPFPDLPFPLHLLIMTAMECVSTGVCRWVQTCWSILILFTLFDSLSCFSCCVPVLHMGYSLHLPGLQCKQLHMTNWGMFIEWNEAIKLTSEQFPTLLNNRLIYQQRWIASNYIWTCVNVLHLSTD